MDWEYRVVKRYYRDGIYEARIIARKDFSREDFPESKSEYRQEFYPCTNFLKALRAMNYTFSLKKNTKEPSKK